jgi:predicted GNAT family acetyltransferase
MIGISVCLTTPLSYGADPVPAEQGSRIFCFFQEIKLRLIAKPAPQNDLISEARGKLRSFLNREPDIRIEDRLFDTDPRDPRKQSRIAQFYESGQDLGQLNYLIQSEELSIDVTIVTEKYRGQGIGASLLESVLKKYPNIKRVSGTYVDQNARAILDAMAKGSSIESAIFSAPTSKTLKRLGFSKVVPGSVRKMGSTFDFMIEKP